MTPSSNLPNASSDNPIGNSMFSGMNEASTPIPTQDQQQSQGATGVVKGFAEVRQSLMKWAEGYPEVSKAVDQAIKQLTNAMYKVAMQSDSKEGRQDSY